MFSFVERNCIVLLELYGHYVFLLITGCQEGFVMVSGSCVGKYVIVYCVYDTVFVTLNFTGMHL